MSLLGSVTSEVIGPPCPFNSLTGLGGFASLASLASLRFSIDAAQTRIALSAWPVQICAPAEASVSALIGAGVSICPAGLPSAVFQMRIVLSSDPEKSFAPSGENRKPVTAALWPEQVCSGLPLGSSQILIVPPSSPVAASLPSALIATERTASPEPASSASFTLCGRRQSFTSRYPPEASRSPDGSNASDCTRSRCAMPGALAPDWPASAGSTSRATSAPDARW